MELFLAVIFDFIIISMFSAFVLIAAFVFRSKIKCRLQDFLEIETPKKIRRLNNGFGNK